MKGLSRVIRIIWGVSREKGSILCKSIRLEIILLYFRLTSKTWSKNFRSNDLLKI